MDGTLKLSRRAILAGSAASLALARLGATLPNKIELGTQTNAWAVDPNRIESLYTVLDRIHELGFKGFETGFRNFQSVSSDLANVRSRVQSTGLVFFGIHIFLLQYDPKTHIAPEDLYTSVIGTGAALGAEHLILSGSPCPTTEALESKTAGLNRAGQLASDKGLHVAYHNHGPEFRNGQKEIQHLIANTDPKLVSFVVDAGHAFRAGADVPSFLAAHANRIVGVHLRDSHAGGEVPLGQGDFPLRATANALERAGWRGWALLEEERVDASKPGDSAIVPALSALKRVFPS